MRARLACWQSVKLDEETNECIAKLEAKLKEFLPDVNWDEVKRETVKIEPGASLWPGSGSRSDEIGRASSQGVTESNALWSCVEHSCNGIEEPPPDHDHTAPP